MIRRILFRNGRCHHHATEQRQVMAKNKISSGSNAIYVPLVTQQDALPFSRNDSADFVRFLSLRVGSPNMFCSAVFERGKGDESPDVRVCVHLLGLEFIYVGTITLAY